MSSMKNFCYILLGIGIGIIGTTIVYERELRKPLCEDEIYIPEEDEESEESDEEEEPDDWQEDESDILDTHRSANVNDDSVEPDIPNPNMKVRYSKMYGSVEPDPQYSNLSAIEKEYYEYITGEGESESVGPDDEPEEDEELGYLDDGLTTELVEPGFAVYIDDMPNDYVELRWYDGDNTLADERDEIIPNPSDVIGKVSIDRLIDRGPGAEDGVIYVRNMKTSINYEVAFCMTSYSETVLGIFESRRKGARGDSRQ